MTQKEFETRFGQEVPTESFDYANRVYMAAGDIDKDKFCEEWKNQHLRNSDTITALTMEVEKLKDNMKEKQNYLEGVIKLQDDLAHFIADMAHLAFSGISNGAELRKKAIAVLGQRGYLKYFIERGYELEQLDRYALVEILK